MMRSTEKNLVRDLCLLARHHKYIGKTKQRCIFNGKRNFTESASDAGMELYYKWRSLCNGRPDVYLFGL
jgi:hypothetical protein